MSSHADYLAQSRFNSLDGLRALSVLAVIWHHTAATHYTDWRADFGSMGMNMFFAISGFLITTLLLREQARHGRIDLGAFYIRRVLRIFPLYFGTLLLYIALVGLLERHTPYGQAFFANLPYFLTFTSNLFVPLDGRVIFYFSWSVATEEQYYLVWPWLLVLCATPLRALWPLGLGLLGLVMLDVMGQPVPKIMPIAIVCGSMLAVLLHLPRGHAWLRPVLGGQWAALAWAALLLTSMVLRGVHPLVPPVIMALLVTSCVIRDDHSLRAFLNWKPLAYLGTISYGLYMLHMLGKNFTVKLLGLFFAVPQLPAGTVFLITTLLTIGLASLSFRYFESYFLSLKSRHQR